MSDSIENSGDLADDMAEYLQTFVDETEEQLDDLVETMLALERDPTNKDDLNEAFRLIHSIKGAAGIMGFDNIMVLTHHLENRFVRLRSGITQLDDPMMKLVLRCIDFLRQCNNRLRDGAQLESAAELLTELTRLEEQADATAIRQPERPTSETEADPTPTQLADTPVAQEVHGEFVRIVARFRAGLPLTDLKAQLIVARLSGLGDVKATNPDLDQLPDAEQLKEFELWMETHEDADTLRAAANVDGVESIDFADASAESIPEVQVEQTSDQDVLTTAREQTAPIQQHTATHETSGEKATSKFGETMRIDIDRLDNLMNLAGELIVNRARFVQIYGQLSPALHKASMLNRIRDFSDSLRDTIDVMQNVGEAGSDWSPQIQHLRAGLELLHEQSEIWDNGRQSVSQMSEAIDQLSRVSRSFQHGVLDTRMVPVGPLFNRFKRIVRDFSKEHGKQVKLRVCGEHTELDKRMIDELGDPLVHLVRNSIDHGLESPEVRVSQGKPAEGTIFLTASHSGNNVTIHVGDDGKGIDIAQIKTKLTDNRVLSEAAVDELSDDQALAYIWHPGFSTARKVTDVSGRGVGMDVVKTRIQQLNGAIEVDSTPGNGTTFTIRLPLTLAIINSLLVRLRNVVFSMPIDNVREIVSVKACDVVTVCGKQTIDVRSEFIPLVSIDDVFVWHEVDYGHNRTDDTPQNNSFSKTINVVILHAGGKTIGLRVEELLGSQDIVIKSLSENFMNIRGLSGASILGDGSVCLMLDVGTVIGVATRPSPAVESEGVAS